MTKDEALRLALEALKDRSSLMKWQEAITAIKAALEAKDEPVAWWIPKHKAPDMVSKVRWSDECEPLYTTPPQRKPLTDEEIEQLIFQSGGHKTTQNLMSNPMQVREYVELWNERIYAFARAIEAAHGIKGEA